MTRRLPAAGLSASGTRALAGTLLAIVSLAVGFVLELGLTAQAQQKPASQASKPAPSADTLDRLCRFFEVQPGMLMQWVPDRR